MQNETIWILGAPDPEMERIEALVRASGARVLYAAAADARVHPGAAYRADGLLDAGDRVALTALPDGTAPRVVAVECDGPAIRRCVRCGGMPDPAHPGLAIEDAGRPGGLGACGDLHVWPALTVLDHHRPGDPGHGEPPARFMSASSLGQALAHLAFEPGALDALGLTSAEASLRGRVPASRYPGAILRDGGRWLIAGALPGSHPFDWEAEQGVVIYEIPADLVLAAAADHCLAGAYAGQCPGVDPNALMEWRAETRAAFQGRDVAAVLADVERGRAALRAAPECYLVAQDETGFVRDLRGTSVPELPEAACREGLAYVATVSERDGRTKVVLGGTADPATVRAFMVWAEGQGLSGVYGDPARGFAGGYLPSASGAAA